MSQITLTLPDGNQRQYEAGISAGHVAMDIATSLGKKAISATVNDVHWDLQWPIEEDCNIAINTMKDTKPALELVRHDLAHIMARAVQMIWPDVQVTIGPVIKDGWYYDFDRSEPFTPDDLNVIEKKMKEIINNRDPIKTEIWNRLQAIQHYQNNNEPYKVELIETIPGNEPLRMYWHGDWQDLCRGPHLQHTGQIPADSFKLMSIAGAYWRGDSKNKMLQRIYGIAFANKEDLKAHLNFLQEAQKRDHRKLGKEMSLFHMQEEAPGMVFWHPNGWTIYQVVERYMRERQIEGGYQEVKTPQVVDRSLWERSGHWDKFSDMMFTTSSESRDYAVKPMNCPCHIQIFNQGLKSYKELPIRMAEFGSCHRNEPSGTLHGIMRVRGFTQDDGHIFCTEEQIESETETFIAFLDAIYTELGFTNWAIKLSTRPEKRIGSDETWDHLEAALGNACRAAGHEFEIQEGEGAFYGPKLEFVLTDAIGREWQCGTLQVDSNMPERLDASYVGQDGQKHQPFMLHRATLGSFERFIGILIEEHAGKLPIWLAPRQVVVATIVSDADDYALEVVAALKAVGVRAETDCRNEKINYKVREHSLGKVPFILALGAREVEEKTVSVRRLGENKTSVTSLAEIIAELGKAATPPDKL